MLNNLMLNILDITGDVRSKATLQIKITAKRTKLISMSLYVMKTSVQHELVLDSNPSGSNFSSDFSSLVVLGTYVCPRLMEAVWWLSLLLSF